MPSSTQISGLNAVAPVVGSRVTAGCRQPELVHHRQRHAPTPISQPATGSWPPGACSATTRNAPARPCASSARPCGSELFGNQNPLGDEHPRQAVLLRGRSACWRQGPGRDGQDQDDTVLMPLRTVQRRLTGNQDVGTLHGLGEGQRRPAAKVMEQIDQPDARAAQAGGQRGRQFQRHGHQADRRNPVRHHPHHDRRCSARWRR